MIAFDLNGYSCRASSDLARMRFFDQTGQPFPQVTPFLTEKSRKCVNWENLARRCPLRGGRLLERGAPPEEKASRWGPPPRGEGSSNGAPTRGGLLCMELLHEGFLHGSEYVRAIHCFRSSEWACLSKPKTGRGSRTPPSPTPAYSPKYAAISRMRALCPTPKGQRLSQWPQPVQSEAWATSWR